MGMRRRRRRRRRRRKGNAGKESYEEEDACHMGKPAKRRTEKVTCILLLICCMGKPAKRTTETVTLFQRTERVTRHAADAKRARKP
jgi:hypothetical protein